MLGEQFEKRLVFFAGKGGVGRTTLSAAIGLAHARRGRRTLIVELGATEQVPALFGRKSSSGYGPTQIHPDLPLFSCHVTPKSALEEYGMMKLKVKPLYKMVFENNPMQRMLEWVPGMNQLLMIGKIWYLEQERLPNHKPAYDRIIVDAPATGHGISLLQLPSVILQQVKSGPFARDTRPIRQMLEDRTRTAVHLVSLPEELPTRESLELAARVKNDLNIKIENCFVNRVWPKPFSSREEHVFSEMRAALKGESEQVDLLLDRVANTVDRRKHQTRYIRELQNGLDDIPVVEIPYLFTDSIGPDELEQLSHYMGKERPS
jgi:anion-transporting  ArsA/GET3 family ATPase